VTDVGSLRAALITGREAVVAERRPAPSFLAPGPDGRLNHGLQGPRVKAPAWTDTEVDRSALRDAWAGFLSPIPFQWFATLTFETNVHPEAALKRYRWFTNGINRTLYGRRWEKRPDSGIHWVVASERQKRGVVHLHALMGDPNDLNQIARRLTWMDKWQEMAGFARIEAIRSDDAALRYVTKYVMKDGDIEFSKNLGAVAQQLPLIQIAK
jgi:hypothetical protein